MVRCDACRAMVERRWTVVRAGAQRVKLCRSCMVVVGHRRHDAQAVETHCVVMEARARWWFQAVMEFGGEEADRG